MSDSPSSEVLGPLAAVDMGSNSFRLEVGQLEQGQYRRIDYIKDTVRLGGGLDEEGRLSEDAAARGFACLSRFGARLAGFEAWQVRAVATQTMREASNRDEFLLRARQKLGYPIEVISGREEARLIYSGVAHLQPSDKPRLVIDIGGRSTELILGQGTTPRAAESFGVGSVSLSMQYFRDGRFTTDAFRAAQVAAGAEIEESLQSFDRHLWREALGSSGTCGAVSQALAAEGITDGRITPDALTWIVERCVAAGHVDKLELAGMRADRRPVIGGGIAILRALCDLLDIRELQPAKGALRQGVIIDLDARLRAARTGQAQDMRDRAVDALQQSFSADKAQAARVERAALALYDSIAPAPANDEWRRELRWAAALHEIGMLVSHHDHHRHSAYLISHADASGFSQGQQQRIGALVLGQRGGLRKVEKELGDDAFARQLLCLRLGVIAAHARGDDVHIEQWHLKLRDREAELRLEQAEPRVLHLLREEAAHWERSPALCLSLEAAGSR